ncbi:MAG: hypothetical protein U9Q63_04425, partial [Patescibacteria group bacterium]|nr:hypothetical protein [Patescibacteria group bacterium]
IKNDIEIKYFVNSGAYEFIVEDQQEISFLNTFKGLLGAVATNSKQWWLSIKNTIKKTREVLDDVLPGAESRKEWRKLKVEIKSHNKNYEAWRKIARKRTVGRAGEAEHFAKEDIPEQYRKEKLILWEFIKFWFGEMQEFLKSSESEVGQILVPGVGSNKQIFLEKYINISGGKITTKNDDVYVNNIKLDQGREYTLKEGDLVTIGGGKDRFLFIIKKRVGGLEFFDVHVDRNIKEIVLAHSLMSWPELKNISFVLSKQGNIVGIIDNNENPITKVVSRVALKGQRLKLHPGDNVKVGGLDFVVLINKDQRLGLTRVLKDKGLVGGLLNKELDWLIRNQVEYINQKVGVGLLGGDITQVKVNLKESLAWHYDVDLKEGLLKNQKLRQRLISLGLSEKEQNLAIEFFVSWVKSKKYQYINKIMDKVVFNQEGVSYKVDIQLSEVYYKGFHIQREMGGQDRVAKKGRSIGVADGVSKVKGGVYSSKSGKVAKGLVDRMTFFLNSNSDDWKTVRQAK